MGGVREGKSSKQSKLVLQRSRGLNSNLLFLVQEYVKFLLQEDTNTKINVRVRGLDRLQRKLMDSKAVYQIQHQNKSFFSFEGM